MTRSILIIISLVFITVSCALNENQQVYFHYRDVNLNEEKHRIGIPDTLQLKNYDDWRSLIIENEEKDNFREHILFSDGNWKQIVYFSNHKEYLIFYKYGVGAILMYRLDSIQEEFWLEKSNKITRSKLLEEHKHCIVQLDSIVKSIKGESFYKFLN